MCRWASHVVVRACTGGMMFQRRMVMIIMKIFAEDAYVTAETTGSNTTEGKISLARVKQHHCDQWIE